MTTTPKLQIKNIVENFYNNDNRSDVVRLIDEYGETFFEDLDYWLPDIKRWRSDQYSIFAGITKLYFKTKWSAKA